MKKTIEELKTIDSLEIIKKYTHQQIKGGNNRAICIEPRIVGGP